MNEETPTNLEVSSEENKKVKKPKSKARKIVEWILTGLFFIAFGLFAAGQIDGMVHKSENYGQTISFGFGSFVILTDSMEPEYMTDSAIITYREDIDTLHQRYLDSLEDESITIDLTFMDVCYNSYKPKKHPELVEQTTPTNAVMTHRLREMYVDESIEYGNGRYTFIVSGINVSEHQSQAGQYQVFTEKQYLGTVQANSKVLGGFYRFISSPWGLLVFLLIPAFYLVITSVLDIFSAMKDDDENGEGGDDNKNTPSSLDELSDKDRERLKKELLEQMLGKKGGDK